MTNEVLIRTKAEVSRDFFIVQSALTCAGIAGHCSRVAMAWWVLTVHGQAQFATFVAITVAAQIGARLAFGGLGDVTSPLKVVCHSAWVAAVATVALALGASAVLDLHFSAVVFLGLVVSIAQGAREPSSMAILPRIAPPELVQVLIPKRSAMVSATQIVGPVLGGVAVAGIGVLGALAASVALFAGASASYFLLPSRLRVMLQAKQASIGQSLFEKVVLTPLRDLQRLVTVRTEFGIALVCFVINGFLPAFFTISVPILIKDELHLGASAIGLLDAAFGIGVLVGGGLIGKWVADRIGRLQAMTAGVVVCGASLIGASVQSNVILIAATLALGGIGLMCLNISISTLRSLAVPKSHMSRFFGATGFVTALSIPAGNMTVSMITVHSGVSVAMWVQGFAILLCAAVVPFIPGLRKVSGLTATEAENYYARVYPDAFAK